MDYPDFIQTVNSRADLLSGTVVSRAVSGKPRLRSYYSQTRRQFTIEHEISYEDKQTIVQHYENNKYIAFALIFQGDGLRYTVQYAGAPVPVPMDGDRWKVTSLLIEV